MAVAVVVVVAWFAILPHGGTPAHGTARPPVRAAVAPPVLDAAESGLLPWHLAAPLSREVVVPGSPGQLIVLGGLTSAGTSASGAYALGTAIGTARRIGALSAPLHDAAGVTSGGRTLVFGGGSPVTVGTVQAFSGAGAARVTGSLPEPRSDAAAVTIGGTAYVVGGYDGSKPDASVLATMDGRTFTTVAALPVPVRYPAVTALDGVIYAFGGQAITGADAGAAVNVIQAVDPARRTATVVGRLPEPLAGAVAVTVEGEVFVAGGDSPGARRPTPGLGTTQLSGAGGSAVSAIWAFDPVTRRLLLAGAPGAGLPRRGRGDRVHRLDRGGRIRQHHGLGGADAATRPRLRNRGRAGGGLAVLRGQAAHRRPRQQPAAADGRRDARGVAVPVAGPAERSAALLLPR